MDLACGTPARPAREFASLQQDAVLPAQFGKVKKDRAADDAAPDDDDLRMTLHDNLNSRAVGEIASASPDGENGR